MAEERIVSRNGNTYEVVFVRQNKRHRWEKRVCVQHNLNICVEIGDEKKFAKGEHFGTTRWRFLKALPKEEIVALSQEEIICMIPGPAFKSITGVVSNRWTVTADAKNQYNYTYVKESEKDPNKPFSEWPWKPLTKKVTIDE